MIPTTADMLQWIQDRLDDFTQPVRLSGRDMPDFMKREFETIKAIRDVISLADDVDQLVKAAKEYIEAVDCADKVPAEKYVRRVRNGQQGLRDALAPLLKKGENSV